MHEKTALSISTPQDEGASLMKLYYDMQGNVTNLNQQISNFEKVTLPELRIQLGDRTREALSKFLFAVAPGGNDYSINYFMSNPNNVTLEDFTQNLIATFENQLKVPTP